MTTNSPVNNMSESSEVEVYPNTSTTVETANDRSENNTVNPTNSNETMNINLSADTVNLQVQYPPYPFNKDLINNGIMPCTYEGEVFTPNGKPMTHGLVVTGKSDTVHYAWPLLPNWLVVPQGMEGTKFKIVKVTELLEEGEVVETNEMILSTHGPLDWNPDDKVKGGGVWVILGKEYTVDGIPAPAKIFTNWDIQACDRNGTEKRMYAKIVTIPSPNNPATEEESASVATDICSNVNPTNSNETMNTIDTVIEGPVVDPSTASDTVSNEVTPAIEAQGASVAIVSSPDNNTQIKDTQPMYTLLGVKKNAISTDSNNQPYTLLGVKKGARMDTYPHAYQSLIKGETLSSSLPTQPARSFKKVSPTPEELLKAARTAKERAFAKKATRKAIAKASRRGNRIARKAHNNGLVALIKDQRKANKDARVLKAAKIAEKKRLQAEKDAEAAALKLARAPKLRAANTHEYVAPTLRSVVPLATPALQRVPRPVMRTVAKPSTEVITVPVVSTVEAPVILTREEKIKQDAEKKALKAERTEIQNNNIKAKADRKAAKIANKGSNGTTPKAKGKKANNKKGNVKSETKLLNIKAGPTEDNNYGWTPSTEEDAFFIMDLVNDLKAAQVQQSLGLDVTSIDEATSPLMDANASVHAEVGQAPAYTQPKGNLMSNESSSTHPATTESALFNRMSDITDATLAGYKEEVNGGTDLNGYVSTRLGANLTHCFDLEVFSAYKGTLGVRNNANNDNSNNVTKGGLTSEKGLKKAFTEEYNPIPEGYYELSTGHMNRIYVNKKGNVRFNSDNANGWLINSENGVFVDHSYIRQVIRTTTDAENNTCVSTVDFYDYLEHSVNDLADVENAQYDAKLLTLLFDIAGESEANGEVLEAALSLLSGVATETDQVAADASFLEYLEKNLPEDAVIEAHSSVQGELGRRRVKYAVLVSTPVLNGKGEHVYDTETSKAKYSYEVKNSEKAEEWEKAQYEVKTVHFSLHIPTVRAHNLLIDGYSPCILGRNGAATTEVTNLKEWFASIKNISSIEICFNAIGELKFTKEGANLAATYPLTTPIKPGQETSVPGFIIKITTGAPKYESHADEARNNDHLTRSTKGNTESAATGNQDILNALLARTAAKGNSRTGLPTNAKPGDLKPVGKAYPESNTDKLTLNPVKTNTEKGLAIVEQNNGGNSNDNNKAESGSPAEDGSNADPSKVLSTPNNGSQEICDADLEGIMCKGVDLSSVVFPDYVTDEKLQKEMEQIIEILEAPGYHSCQVDFGYRENLEYGEYDQETSTILILDSLSIKEKYLVLVHELIHHIFLVLQEGATVLAHFWLSHFPAPTWTPEEIKGDDIEELMAYSFMRYHNIDLLLKLVAEMMPYADVRRPFGRLVDSHTEPTPVVVSTPVTSPAISVTSTAPTPVVVSAPVTSSVAVVTPTEDYFAELEAMCSELGITVAIVKEDSDDLSWGEQSAESEYTICINSALVKKEDYATRVLNEFLCLMDLAYFNREEDNFTPKLRSNTDISQHWVDGLKLNATPETMQAVAAESFSGYIHKIDHLKLMWNIAENGQGSHSHPSACPLFEGEGIEEQIKATLNKRSSAATRKGSFTPAVSSEEAIDLSYAPITVISAPFLSLNSPAIAEKSDLEKVLDSKKKSILLLVTDGDNIPNIYQTAMPTLLDLIRSKTMVLGKAYNFTITRPDGNEVEVYTVCAVNERGILDTEALKKGVLSIYAGADLQFICEQDLGYSGKDKPPAKFLGPVRSALGQAKLKIVSFKVMHDMVDKVWGDGSHPSHQRGDLSLFDQKLIPGTGFEVVERNSLKDGEVVDAQLWEQSNFVKLAVVNKDGTIVPELLDEALKEIKGYITEHQLSAPFYCYSNQAVAFKGLNEKFVKVQYAKDKYLKGINLDVVTLGDDYDDILHSLSNPNIAGDVDRFLNVADQSDRLYRNAFIKAGMDPNLARQVITFLPIGLFQHGLTIVVPGVNNRGQILEVVKPEELIGKSLLNTLLDLNIKVYLAEETYSKDKKKVVIIGKEGTIHNVPIEGLPEDLADKFFGKDSDKMQSVYGYAIGMKLQKHTLPTLDNCMQKHLHDTVQQIINLFGVEEAIEFMKLVLPDAVKKEDVITTDKGISEEYQFSVYGNNPAGYRIKFNRESNEKLSARNCSIITGKAEKQVSSLTNLAGFSGAIYEAATNIICLTIAVASGRKMTQDQIEGIVAGNTSMFSNTIGYGKGYSVKEMPYGTLSTTLAIVHQNSCKTITSVPNHKQISKTGKVGGNETETNYRWPDYLPTSANLELISARELTSKGVPVITDKNGTNSYFMAEGANAMGVFAISIHEAQKLKGFTEIMGQKILLNDVNGGKVLTLLSEWGGTKGLNRPQQFNCASQANATGQVWGPYTTMLEGGNPTTGMGDRTGTVGIESIAILLSNSITATNGSGVGMVRHSDFATIFVPGSIRKTILWSDVPAVQQNGAASGKHWPGLRVNLDGPAAGNGPAGSDKDNKEVPVSKWLGKNFVERYLKPRLDKLVAERGVFKPGQEILELYTTMLSSDGEVIEGYFPDGSTPGLPASKMCLFSNDTAQNCIITGYEIRSTDGGQKLLVVLKYSTFSKDISQVKARGLGIKFILAEDLDGNIDFGDTTLPYLGEDRSLKDLYENHKAIVLGPEAVKGQYAVLTAFAKAHGAAYQHEGILYVDQYLPNGEDNDIYEDMAEADRQSDLTDENSYFYRWKNDNTRLITVTHTLNKEVWEKIVAYNGGRESLPGTIKVVSESTQEMVWETREKDEEGVPIANNATVETVTVEETVQAMAITVCIQPEVATPLDCTGAVGLTNDQAAALGILLSKKEDELYDKTKKSCDALFKAVEAAETHALLKNNAEVDGIFYLSPGNQDHQDLLRAIMYRTSITGVPTLRSAKQVYQLLAAIFEGNEATGTHDRWKRMKSGELNSLDINENGDIIEITNEDHPDGFKYYSVLKDHIDHCLERNVEGRGLAIITHSENDGKAITYFMPGIFVKMGAFEKILVGAKPDSNKPASYKSGAATGIVNDIFTALHSWISKEYWDRTGYSGRTHSINSRLSRSMEGWIGVNSKEDTTMNSKGILKKLVCIGLDAGKVGKICTGVGPQYAPAYFKIAGVLHKLPVAIFHPDCLLSEGLNDGDLVLVSRSPSTAMIFAIVRLSSRYGRKGYIHTCFTTWAEGNNGDSDGDPVARYKVGGKVFYNSGNVKTEWEGITYEQAALLNKHALGMGGYSVVCGEDKTQHDCADFVSYKKMWTKKSLSNKPNLIPDVVQEWLDAKGLTIQVPVLVNLVLPESMLELIENVSNHYTINVGTGYGWASAYIAHLKEKHSILRDRLIGKVLNVQNLKMRMYFHNLESEIPIDQLEGCDTYREVPEYILDRIVNILTSGVLHGVTPEQEAELRGKAEYKLVYALRDLRLMSEADKEAALGLKIGPTAEPIDIINYGKHLGVKYQANAWLWRMVYEDLGLAGYSPKAEAFFEAFRLALYSNDGIIGDESSEGNIAAVSVRNAAEGRNMHIVNWVSNNYRMSIEIAKEILVACMLYNGYRAIEKGQHEPNEEIKTYKGEVILTNFEKFPIWYSSQMKDWQDSKEGSLEGEFRLHSVVAGIFRRSGQGTPGVSYDQELSDQSTAQMLFAYAKTMQKVVKGNPTLGLADNNLESIVNRSISFYTKLTEIADIEGSCL